jgi:SAM-dependent methyltransferase
MKRIPLVQRLDYLKELCSGRSVLHLGCADWPYTEQHWDKGLILHRALREFSGELWGIDNDRESLDLLAKQGARNLHVANLERLEDSDVDRCFDVILAGEVLEHLPNPGLFLRGVQRFMAPETVLCITTINAYCAMRMVQYAVTGRRGRAEPVHPDHVAYYSYSTIRHLAAHAGLSVRRFMFYDLGREHRPFNRSVLNVINDVFVFVAPQLADGIIAECVLGDSQNL